MAISNQGYRRDLNLQETTNDTVALDNLAGAGTADDISYIQNNLRNTSNVPFNSITNDGTHKDAQLDLGFKAQEVEALEVAAGYKKEDETNLVIDLTDDGTKYGIKYEKLVPILVKAIQELEARVKELEG